MKINDLQAEKSIIFSLQKELSSGGNKEKIRRLIFELGEIQSCDVSTVNFLYDKTAIKDINSSIDIDTLLVVIKSLEKINTIEASDKLIDFLDNVSDRITRAAIVVSLANFPLPKVIKTLWNLRNRNDEDPMVQNEIKRSLKILMNDDSANIEMFLDNLEIFQRKRNSSKSIKILIDANLIDEFLLRGKNIYNQDAINVVQHVLSENIIGYLGEIGLRNIWITSKAMKGKEYANRLIIELLDSFNVCKLKKEIIDNENKYPNVGLATAIQVEYAKQCNLDVIITLRDRDFMGCGWDRIYPPAQFLEFLEERGLNESTESVTEKLNKTIIESAREKLNKTFCIEFNKSSLFEDLLPLFDGWRVEHFELLCSINRITSATVVLYNSAKNIRHSASAFKKGSIAALFTAFDKALSYIVKIKHELASIYVANLTEGAEGDTCVIAIINSGDISVKKIYTHKNIIKAYFFAYVQTITAIYDPVNESHPVHSGEELVALYNTGRGQDLSKFKFTGANLSNQKIPGANLSGTDLSNANLSGADLSGVNFSNANLSGADLTKTNLLGANLSNANLNQTNLTGLDETNKTVFNKAILIDTAMPEVKIDIHGNKRMEKVIHFLNQIESNHYALFAVHSNPTDNWWYNELGNQFNQANKRLSELGVPIKRVFILPDNPDNLSPNDMKILHEQAGFGIEIRYIFEGKAKNLGHHDFTMTNLLICKNTSVSKNSFTSRMIVNTEKEEQRGGYISYQSCEILKNLEIFKLFWENAEPLKQDSDSSPVAPTTPAHLVVP